MVRLLLVLMLAACAPQGLMVVDPAASGVGHERSFFVGSTRRIDPQTGMLGGGRSEAMHYGQFRVSVPPLREPGQIHWPRNAARADARSDFITTDARIYSATEFRRNVGAALSVLPEREREVTIFVHGFNNTFPRGLYRLAQLATDLALPGVAAHYSWPSAGHTLGYVQDRDSALFARSGLEAMIAEVAEAGARRIYLVAHSMGGMVAMETMRQMAIRGDRALLDRIAGVVLISPDLDVDLFRLQAREIGNLPHPFIIFGSRRDRALDLSARLTREPARLGNLPDIQRLAGLRVTYLDTAAFGRGAGHFNVGTSPALIRLIARITEVDDALDDDADNESLLPGLVETVEGATEIVLEPLLD